MPTRQPEPALYSRRREKHFRNGTGRCPVLPSWACARDEEAAMDRRQFLQLGAVGGGAVFASALPGCASLGTGGEPDFYFVQLSDTHWGFNGPAVNPDPLGTLPKTIE